MTVVVDQKWIDKYTSEGWWDDVTLIERFKKTVARCPDRLALADPPNKPDLVGLAPERLTYRELDERVDRAASFLLDLGIGKDDVVAVQLPNIVELVTAYLAVWRVGAAITPVAVQWRAHEISYVCKLTEAKAFIAPQDFKGFNHVEMGRRLQGESPTLKYVVSLDAWREAMTGHKMRPDLDPATAKLGGNDIAVIEWTSGTEAESKACPMSHNNLGFLRTLWSHEHEGGILEDGFVIMNPAPLVNITCIGVGLVPWIMCSGTFVLHHPFDAAIYMKQLMTERVNFTMAVPAMAVGMLKHPAADSFNLSSLKYFGQGSAPPPPWSFVEMKKKWGVESMNIWGQNEGTGLFSTPDAIPDLEQRARGFPRPGSDWSIPFLKATRAKIVDPNTGQELTNPGDIGEFCYRSPFTIPCYYKQPELTARAFDEQGFFRTGDLFQILDERTIAFFDRKKDIVIRGGFNVSAAEVENVLKAHPQIMDAAVIGMPDPVLGERVCAYVVPKEGQNVTLDAVKAFMESSGVAVYKWPERVEVVSQIPRNPVGKVLKASLRDDLKQRLEREGQQ